MELVALLPAHSRLHGQARPFHLLLCARKPALRLLRDLKAEQLAQLVVAAVFPAESG